MACKGLRPSPQPLMPSVSIMCVLRVNGLRLNPERLLARISIEPFNHFRKDELIFKKSKRVKRKYKYSGITFAVSDATWKHLDKQIEDAILFIKKHSHDLLIISKYKTVTDICFDFPLDQYKSKNNISIQSVYYPNDFIKSCSKYNISIETSIYST